MRIISAAFVGLASTACTVGMIDMEKGYYDDLFEDSGYTGNMEEEDDSDDAGSDDNSQDDSNSGSQPSSDPSSPTSEPTFEPSSEPGEDPGSEGMLYILTNIGAGEATVAPGTSYQGWESYDRNDGTLGVDQYNCQLVWDTVGAPSTNSTCSDCVFTFEITVTPNGSSQDDGSCSDLNTTMSFGYSYSADYNGAPALFYDGGSGFSAWIQDGYQPFAGYVSSLSFDSATGVFSYASGYRNYYYYYTY